MQASARNSNSSPVVSVIMTTYNGAAHVPHSVPAILDQTFRDFELIVVDDGSKDDTIEILQEFDDKRLRVIPNIHNIGISESRNRAISLSRGEYIACNDQDDISKPSRIETQVQFLRAHPSVALVSASVEIDNGADRWIDPMPVFSDPELLHLSLFFGHHNITYSTVCMRSSVIREYDLTFRQEFHYAEDFEFYHQMAKSGDISTLPNVLLTSRIHGSNASWAHAREMAANGKRFLSREYAELLGHDVAEDDMDCIWRVLACKQGAASTSELQTVGHLMIEIIQAFKRRHVLAEGKDAMIDRFAAKIWWSVVRASAETGLGLPALRLYTAFPGLSVYVPSARERAYSLLKSATPLKIRDQIKKLIGKDDQVKHK